ncbi:MAG: hypothetical protein JXP34_15445 [Planctomycetes bacterium]|nr:hypothetical protein [Planctomycetota bacterium]
MKRRDFLKAGVGAAVGAAAAKGETVPAAGEGGADGADGARIRDPLATELVVQPVLTSIIHTGIWEGPCRWSAVSPEKERANAAAFLAGWSEELREKGLGPAKGVRLLEPTHITFAEDFKIREEDLGRLAAGAARADAVFILPFGSSVSAFEIGRRLGKPILLKGLGCRNVDIAAYCRSKGQEAFVAADDAELTRLLHRLRARKVFRETRVLFPTDWGLPAVCSVGSICDLEGMRKRLGISVEVIPYREMAEEMDRTLASADANADAERAAVELVSRADHAFIDTKYVARSVLFLRAVEVLMARHGCDAFTIECFEFCSSRLPERWTVTPCLIHALLRNRGCASSCEGDLGSLLAMRLLMSVANRSCHQGNSDPRAPGTFRINHSAASMKMGGYDAPDLPYQLGRFVSKGWGTKVVIDFMNQPEKTVTVARVDPSATKLIVLRGELAGASGWGKDLIGCSVEAVIRPPEGRTDEFLRKRLEFGNHLQWVYGDWAEEMGEVGRMAGLEVEMIA